MNVDSSRFEYARELCLKAGSFLLEHEELGRNINTKRVNDYVTMADGRVEDFLISEIGRRFPTDSFYAEESGRSGSTEDVWIIDPIDGTVNFMNAFPGYTISVAFQKSGVVEFGLVYCPRQKLLFSAIRGGGAFLNGRRLSMSLDLPLSQTLVLLVPPHRRHAELDGYMAEERRLYEVFSDVRSIGSAALSLCTVSASWCSAYYERYLNLYDIAAGILIVQEAGGLVKTRVGKDGSIDVLAGRADALEQMEGRLDEAF